MSYRKKLIEVALPLEAINQGSKPETENPFLKGHPRAIHNWWARTPLSVSRSILFAQLIDDPSNDLPPEEAQQKRELLLDFISKIATWDATTNNNLLTTARNMIREQFGGEVPEFWDMFAGRASIPLEAQRLGLTVTSSDLNPIAVTIERTLLEYPPKFNNKPPVHPDDEQVRFNRTEWSGASGLIEDVLWYGKWVYECAQEKLHNLYPKSEKGQTVIAWLWARTIPTPDPFFNGAHVPLVRSFKLSGKGSETWVAPIIDKDKGKYEFKISKGKKPKIGGTVSRQGAVCLLSNNHIPLPYIREQAKKGHMGTRLMAIVVDGNRHREYLEPNQEHTQIADSVAPVWRPDCEMQKNIAIFSLRCTGWIM